MSCMPFIVIRDFNEISDFSDKQGGNVVRSDRIEDFHNFRLDANFLEFPFRGLSYTWSNNR